VGSPWPEVPLLLGETVVLPPVDVPPTVLPPVEVALELVEPELVEPTLVEPLAVPVDPELVEPLAEPAELELVEALPELDPLALELLVVAVFPDEVNVTWAAPLTFPAASVAVAVTVWLPSPS